MKALVFVGMLATGLVAALTGTAPAAPIAYDGIQYPAGPLAGNGPAFGLSAAWVADPGVIVLPAGLASPLDLPSTGGGVGGNFNFQAPLSNLIAPAPGKEFWASFLIFHGAANDQTFMGLSPAGVPPGLPPSVAFGVRLGQYGIFVGGAFTPTPFVPSAVPDLLVMHFVTGGAGWIVTLYVNGLPAFATVVAPVTYGTVVNQNQTGIESDEFRLGDVAGDVSAAGVVPAKGTTWGRVKQLYRQ